MSSSITKSYVFYRIYGPKVDDPSFLTLFKYTLDCSLVLGGDLNSGLKEEMDCLKQQELTATGNPQI